MENCKNLVKPVGVEEALTTTVHRHCAKRSRSEARPTGIAGSSLTPVSAPSKGKNKKTKREKKKKRNTEQVLAGSVKKTKVIWTTELHDHFVAAFNKLPQEDCVPKKILGLMDARGLTRENVASHLQKYRMSLQEEGEKESSRTNQKTMPCEAQPLDLPSQPKEHFVLTPFDQSCNINTATDHKPSIMQHHYLSNKFFEPYSGNQNHRAPQAPGMHPVDFEVRTGSPELMVPHPFVAYLDNNGFDLIETNYMPMRNSSYLNSQMVIGNNVNESYMSVRNSDQLNLQMVISHNMIESYLPMWNSSQLNRHLKYSSQFLRQMVCGNKSTLLRNTSWMSSPMEIGNIVNKNYMLVKNSSQLNWQMVLKNAIDEDYLHVQNHHADSHIGACYLLKKYQEYLDLNKLTKSYMVSQEIYPIASTQMKQESITEQFGSSSNSSNTSGQNIANNISLDEFMCSLPDLVPDWEYENMTINVISSEKSSSILTDPAEDQNEDTIANGIYDEFMRTFSELDGDLYVPSFLQDLSLNILGMPEPSSV